MFIWFVKCDMTGDRTGSRGWCVFMFCRGWCVFMWDPKWDENPCASNKHVVCKKPSRNGGMWYSIIKPEFRCPCGAVTSPGYTKFQDVHQAGLNLETIAIRLIK